MDKEKYFEKIDQYLSRQLSVSENDAFEKEMENDPNLKQDVEEHRLSHEAIELLIEDKLRSNFAQWKTKENGQVPVAAKVSLFQRRSVLMATAAAVLLLVVFGFYKWFSTPYPNERILVEYFQPFVPSDFRIRSTSGTRSAAEKRLNDGLTAYESKDYNTAISFLESIPDTSNQYSTARFALAHTYYTLKDYNLAIQNYKTCIATRDVRNQEKAEWRLLLSYLAADKTDNDFSELLNLIASDPDHSYQIQAKEIKVKMDL